MTGHIYRREFVLEVGDLFLGFLKSFLHCIGFFLFLLCFLLLNINNQSETMGTNKADDIRRVPSMQS